MLVLKMFSFLLLLAFIAGMGFALLFWLPKQQRIQAQKEFEAQQAKEMEPHLRSSLEELHNEGLDDQINNHETQKT